ncbi:hypothetical protein SAMN03080602_03489 [Arenibacter troitsensis]|uniref:Uncharacterized protein n=1 Tax=Arenibacter troitsensis TaxID=188872 RepID=A0A1X7KYQ0_9FLAO|nr:hypothetical protein SAMN03080602_03489 [Arenibacter troitsensis]
MYNRTLDNIGYWIKGSANKTLSNWLNWYHIGFTYGGTINVLVVCLLYRENILVFEFNNNLTLIITLTVFSSILGQIIFPINFIYGLLIRKLEPMASVDLNLALPYC